MTYPPPLLCGTSHDPREGLWMIEFFFINPQFLFVFVSQCLQREHVHN